MINPTASNGNYYGFCKEPSFYTNVESAMKSYLKWLKTVCPKINCNAKIHGVGEEVVENGRPSVTVFFKRTTVGLPETHQSFNDDLQQLKNLIHWPDSINRNQYGDVIGSIGNEPAPDGLIGNCGLADGSKVFITFTDTETIIPLSEQSLYR